MATAQSQLSDTLYSKKQILEVMPNGQGSHVPAVYAQGGTIYALCFSEDANPGLPTVVEISCGTQRKRQVGLFESLKQKGSTVPLFVCLKTARADSSSCPAGRAAGSLRRDAVRGVRGDTLDAENGRGRRARPRSRCRRSTDGRNARCRSPASREVFRSRERRRRRRLRAATRGAARDAGPGSAAATRGAARDTGPAAHGDLGGGVEEGAASGVMVRCPRRRRRADSDVHTRVGQKIPVVVPAGVCTGAEFRVPLPS